MNDNAVLNTVPLGFPWRTFDPFLFCVHHKDAYPHGNEQMGPATSLAGRQLGMDFGGKDGWSMYHGDVVPGFPRHPHRGFETVTIARNGYIDHSDSMGATARFGHGDVQWMTAGKGVVHSEMFPLVRRDAPNPTELFQIWLNLPSANKLVEPHFAMLWNHSIPRVVITDEQTRTTTVRVVAGSLNEQDAPSPPPKSWAAHPGAEVAIWTIQMARGATWTLPPASSGLNRTLYFFRGKQLRVGTRALTSHQGVRLRSELPVTLQNGEEETELLLLQGRPIGEPVVHYGPFVMNTEQEIQKAITDYHRTGYGGWPWPNDGPVHARDKGPFAIHADGHAETGTPPQHVAVAEH